MTPSLNSHLACPPGDEDLPNSASTRAVERGGKGTTASTPGGPATEPPTDPHTPSHTALKPPGSRSEDEARSTPVPVLARTRGVFGEGKDQGSSKRRMAAAGTMAANVFVPNSASRTDRGENSASSKLFMTAKSSIKNWTGGGSKKGVTNDTSFRGNKDEELARNLERLRELTSKVEVLETENDALKKELESTQAELVRRARVIMQQTEQNAKLSKEKETVASLKQPRDINWSYRTRDASLGGEGEAGCDGTPTSRARRSSGEYKVVRRRGLSLTRTDCPEDQAKALKQRIQDLIMEQEKLKTTNEAMQSLINEAETTLAERQQTVSEVQKRIRAFESQVERHRQSVSDLENKISDAQKQLDEINESKETAVSNLEDEREKLVLETNKLRDEKQSLESMTVGLKLERDALLKEKAELEQNNLKQQEDFRKKIADFEEKYSDKVISQAIEQFNSEMTSKKDIIQSLTKQLAELTDNVNEETSKLENIQKKAIEASASAKKELADLQSTVDSKRHEEEQIIKNMEHAQNLVVKANEQLSRLENQQDELKLKIESLEEKSQGAQTKLDQLEKEYQDATANMKAEKAAIESEIAELKSQTEQHRTETSRIESQLASLNQEELKIQQTKTQLAKDVTELQNTLTTLQSRRDAFNREHEKECQNLDAKKLSLQAEVNALAAAKAQLVDEAVRKKEVTIQRVETTDSKSKRSVSTLPGSTDRSETSERSEDFRGIPVESVETFLTSPEELARIKTEVLKVTNLLSLRREELISTEKSLEELHLRRQQEVLACDKLRDSVKQLEELRQTRETEFRSLTDKCDELTRQIEELRATESAMAHDRSRTSSRGLSLEKDDIMRGLNLKDDCWFAPDKSALTPSLANLVSTVPEPDVSHTPDASRMAMALETHLFNLREVHKERDALRDVIVHLEKQKFSLIETIKTLQEEVDDAHTTLSLLRTEIAEGTSKLNALRSELASATAALQLIKDEQANSKKLLIVSNEAKEKCEGEISSFRNSLTTLRRERDQLQRVIEQLREERTRLDEEFTAQSQKRAMEETKTTKETEMVLTRLEEELRRMREAASAEQLDLTEKIEAAREEFTTLNDQIKQRQMDEQARMARVEEDRVRSRQHFENAMKEAEAELKSLQTQVATARSNVRDEMEAETRSVRAQKENELRELQAKIAECENHYKQIRAKVRSQVKLVGRSSLDWVRQAAEHVVAEVILDDIDGLEQDNSSAARLEAKVLDKIRTLQAERAQALSPSSGQPPWASPLSPATHPRFHPGSPVWQRSVEWQGRRASHDGRHPLALFEQRPSVQTSPPPANTCGDSVTQNSTQESLQPPPEGFIVAPKERMFPTPLDTEEAARLLADNAALRSEVLQFRRRLGEATESTAAADTR